MGLEKSYFNVHFIKLHQSGAHEYCDESIAAKDTERNWLGCFSDHGSSDSNQVRYEVDNAEDC